MNRPPSLSAQIQRTMSYLLGDLQDDYAVAGVLHGANHRNILTYLKGSFEAISALVILVLENTTNVRQEIIKQIPTMLPEARVLELSALDQNQVRDVVKHRWEASAGSRDAIPDGGLVTAFSARRWSLAHVMEVMTQMLALKRIQMDSGQVPGIFTDQEISGYLKVLEQRGWKD
jgi:hypothetical protein